MKMSDYIYCDGEYREWAEAPDVPEWHEGVDTMAEALGYDPVEGLELGSDEAGFWLFVHQRMEEREDLAHPFLLELVMGNELRFVYVPDLTQLWRALKELSPIAEAALASLVYRKETENSQQGAGWPPSGGGPPHNSPWVSPRRLQ
jgi:hypothetical protein